jgi:EpsI family protein
MPSDHPKKAIIHWPHVLIGAAMVVASGLAIALTPSKYAVPEGAVDLERMIPKEFGRWKQIESGFIQMDLTPRDGEETTMDQPYDQSLMRAYVRDDGAVVMLALAYGRVQRQEVKVHRPELCYLAQGFSVKAKTAVTVDLGDGVLVAAYRLATSAIQRSEPVTYWIRIGDRITQNAWESRVEILSEGLRGKIPDGVLVRVSSALSLAGDAETAFQSQEWFLRDLWAALDAESREVLVRS